MAEKTRGRKGGTANEPVIENRRARHDYFIDDTLECGVKLTGTEIKSVRAGQASLGEGFARASESPLELTLYGVHIAEYPPAGPHRQHAPTRPRVLLAQRQQIRKLARATLQPGTTLVPLRIYFVRGRAKLLLGTARGKRQFDKRQVIQKRQARRDIEREMR